MSEITVKTCVSMTEWHLLASDWNQLLGESTSPTFFLTWAWLYSWGEVCMGPARELFILTFFENNRMIGIAPLYLHKKKIGLFPLTEVKFLGTPELGADYLDVIAAKGCEKKVATALFIYLTSDACGKWDQLSLDNIRADSLFLVHFMACIEAQGKYIDYDRHAYCPRMHIPESADAFYSMMSSGWRKKFKQDMRVAQRDYPIEFEQIQVCETPECLEIFFTLYEEKAGRRKEPICSILNSYVHNRTPDSALQLDLLLIDKTAVAAILHIGYRDVLSMYIMAVNKGYNPGISFGNLLVGKAISNAIGSDYTTYDFLKGTERYKFHWATEGVPTVKILFRQKRIITLYSAVTQRHRELWKLLLR